MRFSCSVLKRLQQKGEECYWLSPHAGQTFWDLATLAPHSTQYLTGPLLSCMPTDFSSIGMEKEKRD
jgi:hypothetical protein